MKGCIAFTATALLVWGVLLFKEKVVDVGVEARKERMVDVLSGKRTGRVVSADRKSLPTLSAAYTRTGNILVRIATSDSPGNVRFDGEEAPEPQDANSAEQFAQALVFALKENSQGSQEALREIWENEIDLLKDNPREVDERLSNIVAYRDALVWLRSLSFLDAAQQCYKAAIGFNSENQEAKRGLMRATLEVSACPECSQHRLHHDIAAQILAGSGFPLKLPEEKRETPPNPIPQADG
jgi:hypothetical protein